MSIFDQILGQISSNVDIKNLAEKVGIDPSQAEAAIAALAAGHQAPTDTVETAATNSGIDSGILQQIVGHIGGEGALGQFASIMGQSPDALQKVAGMFGGAAEGQGDSNPLGQIAGMAKGLFGN